MDFLDKLNVLMKTKNLNKSTLSKLSGIPYTTIDGWYKKGYESMKLSTLRKLSVFFNTTLDFWANDSITDLNYGQFNDLDIKEKKYDLNETEKKLIDMFRAMNKQGQEYLLQTADMAKDKYIKIDNLSLLENVD